MRIRLTNTSSIDTDLSTAVTWPLAITGRVGECRLFVPRNHAAYSGSYIETDGGSAVEVFDEDYGMWRGVLMPSEETSKGIALTAQMPTMILTSQFLPDGLTFTNVSAGWLFGQIWRYAGSTPFRLAASTFEGGLPVIDSFSFNGQSVWSAWSTLMQEAGCEVTIAADTGVITWSESLGVTSWYGDVYAEAGAFDVRVVNDPSQRVSEVIGRVSGEGDYVAHDGGALADGLGMQALFRATASGAGRISTAENELRRRKRTFKALQANLTSAHAAIRENDLIRLIVPWAELSGQVYECRVLQRGRDDRNPGPTVTLEVLGSDIKTYQPRAVGIGVSGGGGASGMSVRGGRPDRDLMRMLLTIIREWESS